MDAKAFQQKWESRFKEIEESSWSKVESEDSQVIPDSVWDEWEHDLKKFTRDLHGEELAQAIQNTRRRLFTTGERYILAGIEKRDPRFTLQGLAIEAKLLHPHSGESPGNPSFHQSSRTNLDPHWEKIKAQAAPLCERFKEFETLVSKAHHALSEGDIAGVLCYGVAAARSVEAMKLLHLQAAELEGIKTAVGRDKRRADEEDDRFHFQQRCRDYWAQYPNARIRGPQGVVYAVSSRLRVRGGLQSNPSTAVLNRWAQEVAPANVRNRPGRPRKQKP